MKYFFKNIKGFTLVELVISIGIFAMMTALLLAKYGNFNQGILLTNLAYDVALTIRNAQSYGLNVKSAVRNDNLFSYPYGVHFDINSTTFTFFNDFNDDDHPSNYIYDNGEAISTSQMKRGVKISALCVGTGPSDCGINPSSLDVAFKRPNPDAIIKGDGVTYSYAEVTLLGTDGSTRKVVVRSTGQIAVQN
jgi:prepilin-type N-terminal cleavage/methylation domain-containing protein